MQTALTRRLRPLAQPTPEGFVEQVRDGLPQCFQVDESGVHQLTVAFPDAKAVDDLASVLARFLVAGKSGT